MSLSRNIQLIRDCFATSVDFEALRVRASKHTIPWPNLPFRRASVNSFGYGGSNAHVILDGAENVLQRSTKTHASSYFASEDYLFAEEIETSTRPHTLVFSANDEESLKSYCKAMRNHLINPSVNIKLHDLAHTLSERRTRHFHRAFVVIQNATLDKQAFVYGKKNTDASRIAFVFTGQGAQWSQIGKGIIDTFPAARPMPISLDDVLQGLPTPPKWSLLSKSPLL
jgi:acyl transferase domain-containing protein